jgi:hypothetical protein
MSLMSGRLLRADGLAAQIIVTVAAYLVFSPFLRSLHRRVLAEA